MVAERTEALVICRHSVIRKVPANHLTEPAPLLRDRLVHSPPQCRLHLSQLGPHPISARPALQLESTSTGVTADVSEAQKVERFRLSKTLVRSIFGRIAAKFDQPRLVRMQR